MRKFIIFIFYSTLIEIAQLTFIMYWLYQKKVAIYGTNDDALISSISSGQLTGTPDPHLIFIQPFISYPIVWLDGLLTNYSGYSFFLLFCTTISFTLVLVNKILNKEANLLFVFSWFITNCLFQSWFAINPTYTGASLLASGAAAALSILLFKDWNQEKLPLILSIPFLFLLSYFTRIEGIYIYLVVLIPFIFLYMKEIYRIRRVLLFIVISIFIPLMINMGLNNKLYSNNSWSEYTTMNHLRHQIQLREPERQLEKSLVEIGWDESTSYMFKRFILLNSDSMNSSTMEKIIKETSDYVGIQSVLKSDPMDSIVNVVNSLKPWTWILQTLTFIIALNIYFRLTERKLIKNYIIEVSILTASIFGLLYILAGGFHLPERITLNVLAAYALALIILSPKQLFIIKDTNIQTFILLISVFFTFKQLDRLLIELGARENFYKTRQVYASQQKDSLGKMGNDIVISSASNLKLDWVFPYNKYESFDSRNRTLILGWHNLSPIWDKAASNLNLNPDDIYLSLLEDKTLWVDSERNIDLVNSFLQKYLRENIQFNKLGTVGNDEYSYYKFSVSKDS